MRPAKNVLGGELEPCSFDPITGYFRDGCCNTGAGDRGLHLVCIQATADFLEFSEAAGNDLTTRVPEYQFPGLTPGDRWCLCVERWKEALDADMAPPVVLAATHISALEFVTLDELKARAIDWPAEA